MIGDRVYFVQPAIVDYGLTTPGGGVSPPRLASAGGGGPLALQVLPMDLKVQKETKVIREIEVQEEIKGIKVIKETLVHKGLLVCKLELEVHQ